MSGASRSSHSSRLASRFATLLMLKVAMVSIEIGSKSDRRG
jgi:hypothetical protein